MASETEAKVLNFGSMFSSQESGRDLVRTAYLSPMWCLLDLEVQYGFLSPHASLWLWWLAAGCQLE